MFKVWGSWWVSWKWKGHRQTVFVLSLQFTRLVVVVLQPFPPAWPSAATVHPALPAVHISYSWQATKMPSMQGKSVFTSFLDLTSLLQYLSCHVIRVCSLTSHAAMCGTGMWMLCPVCLMVELLQISWLCGWSTKEHLHMSCWSNIFCIWLLCCCVILICLLCCHLVNLGCMPSYPRVLLQSYFNQTVIAFTKQSAFL